MKDNIDALINQIVDDAEKKIRTDLKVISSKVQDDFAEKAKEVVLLYYTNYPKPPRIYERTYNLYNNVIDYNISFGFLKKGRYDSWLQFNSDNMKEYTDGGNKDEIVKNFMMGIHSDEDVFVEENPAKYIMDAFQHGYKKNKLDGYFRQLGYSVK